MRLAGALLLAPLGHAAGQQADTTFHLSDIVVTATRTPKLLKDVPIQTQLITARDIERTDATNVQDLLQQEMPGVEFSYAMNQQIHLNFCGFGGQSVLFLVDGERLAGETMDDVDFTRLSMADVERIEIVKGAASALYGSNASGGVINIITKTGGDPWTLNLNARTARHNEQRYGAGFGLNQGVVSNRLHFNYTGIDNFDVANGPHPQTRVYSTVYGNQTYNIRDQLSLRPTAGMRLTARAGYFYRTLSRTPDTPERYRDFSAGLRGTWEISWHDNIDLSYSFDQYDKSDYQRLTALDIRDYSNVQNTVRGTYSHHFPTTTLTLGADYTHDYLFNRNLSGRTRQQDTFDAFAQADWTASPRWELVAALRYDYFSDQRHSRLTPKLSARYRPHRDLTLRLGYGMGFRAPTLKEKYYDFDMSGIWIVQGNDQLQSEVSHNLNLSAEYTHGRYNLTGTLSYNNVENKIATGAPRRQPGGSPQLYLPYINLDRYSVYGCELTAQARFPCGITAKLSYTFTREQLPRDNDAGTAAGQYIPARRHTLTTRIEWDRQFCRNYGLNICLSGRLLSAVTNVEYTDYYDIAQGTTPVRYPAYTLWRLSTAQRLGPAVRLTLALDNLFNYRPRYHYLNAPVTDGINLQAGISVDVEKIKHLKR